MAKFEDLEDVTIRNPKAGDVVKYTATGWVNGADATGTPPGGNPCGNNNFSPDKSATITEPWTWEVGDAKCGVIVEHQDGVNNLDEYSRLCPGRVEVGNKNGRGELKTFDGGNTRLSAFDSQLSFYDMNNQSGVTLSELVACCDGEGGGSGTTGRRSFEPMLVTFPNLPNGVFTYQHSGRATTADPDGSGDPEWTSTEIYDVFNAGAGQGQTIEMPAGANAAFMLYTYEAKIGPWNGVLETSTGYANLGSNVLMFSNKNNNNITSGPGPLAASIRLFGDILGWNDGASQIGSGDEDLRQKRTPAHSGVGQRMVRVSFDESLENSITRITLRPQVTINRIRGCECSVGVGRVLLIPYKDDGTNWLPEGFALFDDASGTDYPNYFDDNVVEKGFDERLQSVELKQRMNYMTNAIRETLDYDTQLPPEAPTVLEKALNDIFNLKRVTVDSYEYYETELENIKTSVLPYVGFTFGFENDETAVRSF